MSEPVEVTLWSCEECKIISRHSRLLKNAMKVNLHCPVCKTRTNHDKIEGEVGQGGFVVFSIEMTRSEKKRERTETLGTDETSITKKEDETREPGISDSKGLLDDFVEIENEIENLKTILPLDERGPDPRSDVISIDDRLKKRKRD